MHRTIRTALGEALRRGYESRNVATIAKPPRVEVEPVEPYTLEEIRAILTAAQQPQRRTLGDRFGAWSAAG